MIKFIFVGLTQKGELALRKWANNNKEFDFVSQTPLKVMEKLEGRKEKRFKQNLRRVFRKLGTSEEEIFNNPNFKATWQEKILDNTIKKLKVLKDDISLEVEFYD